MYHSAALLRNHYPIYLQNFCIISDTNSTYVTDLYVYVRTHMCTHSRHTKCINLYAHTQAYTDTHACAYTCLFIQLYFYNMQQ